MAFGRQLGVPDALASAGVQPRREAARSFELLMCGFKLHAFLLRELRTSRNWRKMSREFALMGIVPAKRRAAFQALRGELDSCM